MDMFAECWLVCSGIALFGFLVLCCRLSLISLDWSCPRRFFQKGVLNSFPFQRDRTVGSKNAGVQRLRSSFLKVGSFTHTQQTTVMCRVRKEMPQIQGMFDGLAWCFLLIVCVDTSW